MTTPSARAKKSIGGEVNRVIPGIAAARDSVTNIERLLEALLKMEIERFREDSNLLRTFFSYFFRTLGEAEREEFVTNFVKNAPLVQLGFARAKNDTFPIITITLGGEEETTKVLGDYIGEQDFGDEDGVGGEDDEAMEFEGGQWSSTFDITIWAQHPDVCLYIYNFVKMVLIGGRQLILSQGVQEFSLSGAEINPAEEKLPDNMFVRVIHLSAESITSVPRFSLVDPRRLVISGLFLSDVVVDGVRGGVTPYVPEELPDEEG